MTLLTVVQDVCARVGVAAPIALIPTINSNRTARELLACANEMAQRIAYDTREWQAMKKSVTYTGNGVTTAFNLPADYKRMLLTTSVWRSTSAMQPMRYIADTDEWLQRRAANWSDAWGEWTLLGNQILIWPAMGVGTTARFSYLDKNCVALDGGGYANTFLNDDDVFRLDERILKLGMIFDWKQSKGSPYAEDMGTWSDAMALAMGADKPMPIMIDRAPISAHARGIAYPFALPTP